MGGGGGNYQFDTIFQIISGKLLILMRDQEARVRCMIVLLGQGKWWCGEWRRNFLYWSLSQKRSL